MLTSPEQSLGFGRCTLVWHWCSGCTLAACHRSGTYENRVRYRADGALGSRRTGSQHTSGAYRYHMRGRSCCEQCDYRHADCLVPSWMPWEQRIMALWTSVDNRAEAGQRVARERSGSIAVGEDARCDDNGQVEAAAAGSPVWR